MICVEAVPGMKSGAGCHYIPPLHPLVEGYLSIKVMSRVWESDLLSSDKFILLAFADHSDDSGYCYPSLHRVAWKCGVSKDTIRRAIARLVFKGIVTIVRPGTGRGHTTLYRISTEKGSNLQPLFLKGSHPATERVAPEAIKGSTLVIRESSVLEPSYNPTASPFSENYFQHPRYGEARRKRYEKEHRKA